MTEEQKALLEAVAEELGGKIVYQTCISKHSEYQQIIIEYANLRKSTDLS